MLFNAALGTIFVTLELQYILGCLRLYSVISFMNEDSTTCQTTHSTAWLTSWRRKVYLIPFDQSMPAASHPPTTHHCETPGSISLLISLKAPRIALSSPKSHLFSRLNKPHFLSISSRSKWSSTNHPDGSYWTYYNLLMPSVLRAQNWTWYYSCGLTNAGCSLNTAQMM